MSTSIDRAVDMAGPDFADFTPEQLAEILDREESKQGFAIVRAAFFQMKLQGERAQRRTMEDLAALNTTEATWVNKDRPAFEFTEAMYGQSRMTNTDDEPEGFQGK